MTISVTEFKNLLNALDQAGSGEPIEVIHHGRKTRIVPDEVPSKFSRLVKRDTLRMPADQLESAIAEMNREAMAEWDKNWS